MFHPFGGGQTTFKFLEGRKLRIEGCATKEDLANPAEFDSEGQPCLIVGKDGNTTDLTVGCYAGLESFTQNEVGVESIELAIYNSGVKGADSLPKSSPLRRPKETRGLWSVPTFFTSRLSTESSPIPSP
jgi:hypothetical protein